MNDLTTSLALMDLANKADTGFKQWTAVDEQKGTMISCGPFMFKCMPRGINTSLAIYMTRDASPIKLSDIEDDVTLLIYDGLQWKISGTIITTVKAIRECAEARYTEEQAAKRKAAEDAKKANDLMFKRRVAAAEKALLDKAYDYVFKSGHKCDVCIYSDVCDKGEVSKVIDHAAHTIHNEYAPCVGSSTCAYIPIDKAVQLYSEHLTQLYDEKEDPDKIYTYTAYDFNDGTPLYTSDSLSDVKKWCKEHEDFRTYVARKEASLVEAWSNALFGNHKEEDK